MILYNIGLLYSVRSEYENAVQSLVASISQNPNNVHAYLALGDAYERQGDSSQALQVFKNLQNLNKNVHGLREKIVRLETQKQKAHEEQLKREQQEQEA